MTATTKAMMNTIIPGPLIRSMENPPLAGLDADGLERGYPEIAWLHCLKPGPRPAPLPPRANGALPPPSEREPYFRNSLRSRAGGEQHAQDDHHQVVADVDGGGRAEHPHADLAQQLHPVPQRHGLDQPLDVLRVHAERVERGAEQEHRQHHEVDPVHLLEGLQEAGDAHPEAGEAEGDQHRGRNHQDGPWRGDAGPSRP